MRDSVAGKKLTEDCKKEMDAFKIDRATNINKNLPLGGWPSGSLLC